MAFGVIIKRPATAEQVLLVTAVGKDIRVAPETEVASRFGLNVGEFQIFEESGGGLSIGAESRGVGDQRVWYLKCGNSYTLSLIGSGSRKGLNGFFSESTAVGDGLQDRDFTDEYVRENEEPPLSTQSPNSSNLGDPLGDVPVGDNTADSLGNDTPSFSTPRQTPSNVVDPIHDTLGDDNMGYSTPRPSPTNLGDPLTHIERPHARLGLWNDEFLVNVPTTMLHGRGNSKCV